MNINRSTVFVVACLAVALVVSGQEAKKSGHTNNEGANRDMLLNAASASQPRTISLGLPGSLNAYIYEDGLPVSYYNFQLYPYKSWHSGVSHETVGTMSPQNMVLKYGIISYGVESRSKLAGETFEGRLNYTLNQFGRQTFDLNLSTPLEKGWGISLGSYQNFDPHSNHLDLSSFQERVQFYKGSLSKTWHEGRGRAGLIYQYATYKNIIENFGPFIFVGDGSVKSYNGFDLGHDQYIPANNTFTYKDLKTGRMVTQHIDKGNTDRVHNVNFVLDYRWENGMNLEVNSKLKYGHSYRANPSVTGMIDAVEGSGITYEDHTPYIGPAQNRRRLIFDAFEHSWMTNASLKGRSGNLRHNWQVELDYWLNSSGTYTSMAMSLHEVKKNPKLLLLNGKSSFSHNSYAEFYDGNEHKLFGFVSDEWTISDRLWLMAGLRLEYLNVNGYAANDIYPENVRYAGFSLTDKRIKLNRLDKNHFNHSYIASGRFIIAGGLGLQAEYSSATIHSQLFHYGAYSYPTQKGITANYFRGGIFYKNNWIDLTSVITHITMSNSQNRPMLNHVLIKDAGDLKAGQNETVTIPVYYNMATLGWVTDAVVTPFEGFKLHALFTLRNPTYQDFELNPTFSDGVTEHYDFSGKNITGLSKVETEIEPSYTFDRWRVWLSARYFGKQYINKTNSLFFNGRWETFGGVDFTFNKHVDFSVSFINLLNQKGADGSISSADLVTDPAPYKNYLMSGTFIRPFTVELTTKIKF